MPKNNPHPHKDLENDKIATQSLTVNINGKKYFAPDIDQNLESKEIHQLLNKLDKPTANKLAGALSLSRAYNLTNKGELKVNGIDIDERYKLADMFAHGGRLIISLDELKTTADKHAVANYLFEFGDWKQRTSTHSFGGKTEEGKPLEAKSGYLTQLIDAGIYAAGRLAGVKFNNPHSGLNVGIGNNPADGKHGHMYAFTDINNDMIMIGLEGSEPGKANAFTGEKHGIRAKASKLSSFGKRKIDKLTDADLGEKPHLTISKDKQAPLSKFKKHEITTLIKLIESNGQNDTDLKEIRKKIKAFWPPWKKSKNRKISGVQLKKLRSFLDERDKSLSEKLQEKRDKYNNLNLSIKTDTIQKARESSLNKDELSKAPGGSTKNYSKKEAVDLMQKNHQKAKTTGFSLTKALLLPLLLIAAPAIKVGNTLFGNKSQQTEIPNETTIDKLLTKVPTKEESKSNEPQKQSSTAGIMNKTGIDTKPNRDAILEAEPKPQETETASNENSPPTSPPLPEDTPQPQ